MVLATDTTTSHGPCVKEHSFCLRDDDCCPAFLGKYASKCVSNHCKNQVITSRGNSHIHNHERTPKPKQKNLGIGDILPNVHSLNTRRGGVGNSNIMEAALSNILNRG